MCKPLLDNVDRNTVNERPDGKGVPELVCIDPYARCFLNLREVRYSYTNNS